jgi:hypothetical protein
MATSICIAVSIVASLLAIIRLVMKRISASNVDRISSQIVEASKNRIAELEKQDYEMGTRTHRSENQIREGLKRAR